MTTLYAAWAVSLVASGWLLGVGAIRLIAHRSGEVDHTRGMRNVANLALGLGALSAVTFVVLTVVLTTQ